MFIQWIEARNKENGFMLKHSEFDQLNFIKADDPADHLYFFQILKELSDLAVGRYGSHFLNQICRVQVQTPEASYLWYAKTTPGPMMLWQENNHLNEKPLSLLDEEEIYTDSDQLLFSRNQQGAQCFNPDQFIPLNPTTSTPCALGFPETKDLFNAFQQFYTFQMTTLDTTALQAFIKALPDNACLLLDAHTLAAPLDLTSLRNDFPASIQLIALHAHAQGHSQKTLLKKRNGLALS